MKKSEIFRLAQIAVLQFPLANSTEKLEVLREMMSQEDMWKLVEERTSQDETV